jgi:hypothetical protein
MCECALKKVDIDNIAGIVTLGSPNLPSSSGSIGITGGALGHVSKMSWSLYFKKKMFYLTVARNAFAGDNKHLGEQ